MTQVILRSVAQRRPQGDGESLKRKKNATSLPVSEDRIPVIVGVGEIVDRPKEIAAGLEPLALLVEALKRAEAGQRRQIAAARSSRSTSSIS